MNSRARRGPDSDSCRRAVLVLDQPAQRAGDAVAVGLGVLHRVAADLGQREPRSREDRGTARHRLEHRQAEALGLAGERDDQGAAEQAGQVGRAQEAGPHHLQRRRHLGDRLVDLVVPAAAAGEDQCRRLGQLGHRLHPAAHQVGDVLAALEHTEERDVGAPVQPQPVGHALRLGVGRRVERREVDAVAGHVDRLGVAVDEPDELVLGRLRRHDHPRRATHRRAGRGAVEAGPDGAVQLGLRDERDVVHGHHHRHRRVQRHRVVGRVDQ